MYLSNVVSIMKNSNYVLIVLVQIVQSVSK